MATSACGTYDNHGRQTSRGAQAYALYKHAPRFYAARMKCGVGVHRKPVVNRVPRDTGTAARLHCCRGYGYTVLFCTVNR